MNNSIAKLGIVLVALIGVGGYVMHSFRSKNVEAEHRLDLERIRREYLEREPLARLIPDPERYRIERQQLTKWYFNELTDHYNRFPAFKGYDRFMADLEERKRSRKVRDQEYTQYAERFKVTKALWERFKSGKYDPAFTAQQNGLRFDVYDVQAVLDPKEPKLRFSFALYGAQRKWSMDSTSGAKVMRLNVNAAFHELVFSGLDANGKSIREMRASGDPFKVDNGERFIEEFPPGTVFGSYDLPKIPAEVVNAELTFDISTRSVLTGEEMGGKFVWKLPVPADWKLPQGASWEGAQEQVREQPEAPAPHSTKARGRK